MIKKWDFKLEVEGSNLILTCPFFFLLISLFMGECVLGTFIYFNFS